MSTLITNTIQDVSTIKRSSSVTAATINSDGIVTLNQQPMFQLGGVTGTIAAAGVIPMKQLPAGGTVGDADSFLLGGCTFNDGTSELTLANAGRYMMSCTVLARTTSNNNQMGPLKMQRKAAGGTYSSVTHSQLYKEAYDGSFNTFSATWVQNVAAGDVFRWINNNASHGVQFPTNATSGFVFNGFLLTTNVT